MFKLWIKTFKNGKILKDMVVDNAPYELNRTRKIYFAIDEACRSYDLSKPLWLEKNIKEFKKSSKTRFTADNFIDGIDFDFLEVEVLEEYF